MRYWWALYITEDIRDSSIKTEPVSRAMDKNIDHNRLINLSKTEVIKLTKMFPLMEESGENWISLLARANLEKKMYEILKNEL